MSSFSSHMSEKRLYITLFLKAVFIGFKILIRQFFCFSSSKIWLHCLLTCIVSDEQSAVTALCLNLLGSSSLPVVLYAHLGTFFVLSLFFILFFSSRSSTVMCLGVVWLSISCLVFTDLLKCENLGL